jgi:hypothetical protein
MKNLITILVMAIATTAFAADKAPAKKEAPKKVEKCIPSKEVVCDKNLQGKTRPKPKKQVETTK